MPAKPSGEIKTKIVHQTQKNGDIYVLERKTIYDPEKNIRNYADLISHFLLKNTVCLRVSESEMYQLFLHSS